MRPRKHREGVAFKALALASAPIRGPAGTITARRVASTALSVFTRLAHVASTAGDAFTPAVPASDVVGAERRAFWGESELHCNIRSDEESILLLNGHKVTSSWFHHPSVPMVVVRVSSIEGKAS